MEGAQVAVQAAAAAAAANPGQKRVGTGFAAPRQQAGGLRALKLARGGCGCPAGGEALMGTGSRPPNPPAKRARFEPQVDTCERYLAGWHRWHGGGKPCEAGGGRLGLHPVPSVEEEDNERMEHAVRRARRHQQHPPLCCPLVLSVPITQRRLGMLLGAVHAGRSLRPSGSIGFERFMARTVGGSTILAQAADRRNLRWRIARGDD